jgi:flavin-dependent dehydrogenase
VGRGGGWGRALGRDVLDAWLLDAARAAGAEVLQPARAVAVGSEPGRGVLVQVEGRAGTRMLEAPVAVAAHGSWRPGPLPAQPARSRAPGDLLGFKAHFEGARLAPDLMALLAFRGGYGGLVTADGGRVSLSCCIRRDRLAALRARAGGRPAGEAVLAHVLAASAAADAALGPARRIGPWLSAGPIRPGLKPVRDATAAGALFRAGNAAAEAHPVIAEGISMAVQSGWLLAMALLARGGTGPEALDAVARRYGRELRQGFGPRIRASAALAALAASPLAHRLALPLVEAAPGLIALGARASGKYSVPPGIAADGVPAFRRIRSAPRA